MIKSFITYSFLFLAFISCKKENAGDCFKSNGSEITESRFTESFTKVEMNDKIDVTISCGTEFNVEVFGGKHILISIYTKVKDGVLIIENHNKCNFVRGYKKRVKVNLTLPYLYSAVNNGVATLIINDGFTQDSVRIRAESSGDIHLKGTYSYIKAHANGNGDVYLKGACNSLVVYINGTNYLRASELKIKDWVFIETLTKGDCYLNAEGLKKLEYLIYQEGNIYYKGHPASIIGSVEADAKGKVIQED